MKLKKIKYKDLNHRAKETFNFQKISSILVDYGFATNWLNVDFESADFIAAHFDGINILKIQLKSRVTINKKYIGKKVWIAFPIRDIFYLIPHDDLIKLAGKTTNWLKSPSWVKNSGYSTQNPSAAMKKALLKYKL